MSAGGFTESASSSNPTSTQTSGSSSPVAGGNLAQNNGGTQLSSGGPINLTADPAITGQAFDAITYLVNQALIGQNKTAQAVVDANGQNQNQSNALLDAVLSRDQATAANTATGGASGTQSFTLWGLGIAAAAVVALAALFINRRK